MKIAKRDPIYTEHSRHNHPHITVEPGERFLVETELCSGRWLQSPEDQWDPSKTEGANPCVCVSVAGAQPGDMLAVAIDSINVGSLGYTGFHGDHHSLAHRIHRHPWELTTKTVSIRDGFVEWDLGKKLPVRPMIGTLGTAPEREVISNSSGGPHGGNMDAQEITTGTTVYLPVHVPGGLLHIGDAHALQGDGEINGGGGIECRATVEMTAHARSRFDGMQWIRAENAEYLITVACSSTAEESFYQAAGELLRWVMQTNAMSEPDAYLLLGQVMEARCTQFVNPTRTYVCKIRREYL